MPRNSVALLSSIAGQLHQLEQIQQQQQQQQQQQSQQQHQQQHQQLILLQTLEDGTFKAIPFQAQLIPQHPTPQQLQQLKPAPPLQQKNFIPLLSPTQYQPPQPQQQLQQQQQQQHHHHQQQQQQQRRQVSEEGDDADSEDESSDGSEEAHASGPARVPNFKAGLPIPLPTSALAETTGMLPFTLQSGEVVQIPVCQLDAAWKDFTRYFRTHWRNITRQDEENVKCFRRRYQLRKSSKKGRNEQRERQRVLEIQVQEAARTRLSVDQVLQAIEPVVRQFLPDAQVSSLLLTDMSSALAKASESLPPSPSY